MPHKKIGKIRKFTAKDMANKRNYHKIQRKIVNFIAKPGEIKSFTTHGKIKNFNGRHGKMTSPNKKFLDWQTQKFYCKRKGKNQKLPQKVQ